MKRILIGLVYFGVFFSTRDVQSTMIERWIEPTARQAPRLRPKINSIKNYLLINIDHRRYYSKTSALPSERHFVSSHRGIRENVLSLWKRLDGVQGWKTLEDNNLVLLKSQIINSSFNLAWGVNCTSHLESASKFFKGQSFTSISSQGVNTCIFHGYNYTEPDLELEMEKNLEVLSPNNFPSKLQVKQVQSPTEYDTFILFASKIFSISYAEFRGFLSPMQEYFTAFLAYDGETIVGTSQFYLDEEGTVGIQTVAVSEESRRSRIGAALTDTCLKEAKARGAKRAILSASYQGEKLYRHMGFTSVHTWALRPIQKISTY